MRQFLLYASLIAPKIPRAVGRIPLLLASTPIPAPETIRSKLSLHSGGFSESIALHAPGAPSELGSKRGELFADERRGFSR
jgi:hypothetical protein